MTAPAERAAWGPRHDPPGRDHAWADWLAGHPGADRATFDAGFEAALKIISTLECWHGQAVSVNP